MLSKKLMNDPSRCVQDMLAGLKVAYPALAVNPELGLSFLSMDRGNKVGILSGGGSGHEPFAAGFLGHNMLTGAVSGNVFTSPPVSAVFTAITYLSRYNKGGVLVIIMNYTGDQLNFGLAIEHAKSNGVQVESISVNDDCALLGHKSLSVVGRRGICGCAIIFKILGALSDASIALDDIVQEYNELEPRIASMGACLQPCTLPTAINPLFSLAEDEVSLGCGVHGEAGIATIQMAPLNELVEKVLMSILKTGIMKYGNQVCVLIGNLGSTTEMECLIVAKEVQEQLGNKGIRIERLYVGTLMSSLDMKGFQVSVLNVTGKAEWLKYLDQPTEAFGWPGSTLSANKNKVQPPITPVLYSSVREKLPGMKLTTEEAAKFRGSVMAACNAIKENTEEINQLDTGCGDGDTGSTLASLADGILTMKDKLPWRDVAKTLWDISIIAETQMGGTSGAVYSLLLQGASKSANSWHSAWSSALTTLYKYSPARIGYRTLVDALAPGCDVYNSYISQNGQDQWEEGLRLAVLKAVEGSKSTLNMEPKVGRACYTESCRVVAIDAGAYGVAVWLSAIADTLLS